MPRAAVATLLLVAACGHGDPVESAIIAPLQVPCVGVAPQLCLLMTPEGEAERREYDGIEGFTHKWGVESEILFKTEPVEDPPADASSQRLILAEVVAENPIVVDPFTLDFSRGPGWFDGSGPELDLFGTAIACEQAVCDQLIAADASDAEFTATFEIVDPQTLRATAVVGQ